MTLADTQWFFQPGWRTSHLLQPHTRPSRTLCGRAMPGPLAVAPNLPRCGQCAHRRTSTDKD